MLNNLAQIQSRISRALFNQSLQLPQRLFQTFASRNLSSAIVDGSGSIVFGIIGNILLILTELFLLFILTIPLIIFAPLLSLLIGSVLGVVFFGLYRFLGAWSIRNGQNRFNFQNSSKSLIVNSGELSKSLMTSNEFKGILRKFDENFNRYTQTHSESFYMQQIPKYVFELTLVAIGILCGVFFFIGDSFGRSIGILTLILASTLRILPSLLRLQGAILYLKASFGESLELFSILRSIHFENLRKRDTTKIMISVNSANSLPQVNFENVSFQYSDSKDYVVKDLSFKIHSGDIFSLEGKSGSGKTTVVDLILNLLEPTEGRISYEISDANKLAIGYMPQETILLNGTLRENIALGIEPERVNEKRIIELMHILNLFDLSLDGPDMLLGNEGLNISGGQKQRIGVARALYSSPNLLVFDEPTTALDKETEGIVFEAIVKHSKQATTIIVSHQGTFSKISNRKLKIVDFTCYEQ